MKTSMFGARTKRQFNSSHMAVSTLVLSAVLGLSACGGSGPETVTPVPPAVESPVAGTESYTALKADGTMWVNQNEQKVSLRGINIGNWLSMELWMFDNGDNPLGENIPDQCSLEETLTERFGEAEKDRLIKLHRDSWFTEADWDVIAEAGFNVVRVPFPYSLIENDDAPMTLKDDAWEYLDWAVAEAKKREIYVVLDLHGAVGGQGVEQHTGCEGQNELWSNDSYQERTKWLWGEIAKHYQGEATVAGYGLLNEPWGTDSATLRDFSVELYDAIRAHDEEHVVILAGHNADGISAYGDPMDYGMENVAFEPHFYPGLFGWGEIGYNVHRDWLTCGENGDSGVCDWANRARKVYTPMLVGEMQPWNGLGEMGGEITRATFDTYNDLNWAGTAWSYKVATASGGLGNGTWGYVTNNGDQLITKAQTWGCAGWESTFANACDVPASSTTPYEGEGTKTMYLVIKTGGFNGVDVVYDSIQLNKDSDGTNIIVNGEFGSGAESSWTEVSLWGDPRNYEFGYSAGEFAGSDSGEALRVTSPAGSHALIYQAVEVEGGESYTLSGKFTDLGSSDTWAEIYLVPDMPQEWVDVTGRAIPSVNVNSSSIEEIEEYFSFFAIDEMDYVVNHWVKKSLTSEEPATIFTNIPGKASNLVLDVSDSNVALSWDSAEGEVVGYKVYRSLAPRSGFEEIATVEANRYNDDTVSADTTYYYYVAAFNDTDEGYASEIMASGETFYTVPTKIEAESYSAAHPGVQTESAGDEGGGFNIGSFESGYWVDYDINVPSAGSYVMDFRLASQVGSVQFEVIVADQVLTTVTVPNTGGWQSYQTLSFDVELPEGRSTLRLRSVDNQWNLNWFEIKNP
ncbi:carbohydrate-binding protein [Gilvimarinus sp. SDUM040013]|uniref:Exo-1,3-beta-glucanase D n=1 Tax=Gilvimarinus gilvus TaxID=3058038 RepID=A0ABU4S1D8_9GAMM|nr:carbohydrate-binding protein [Gilvimarinus sp. SDUM040013]MDO3384503.1 carbohydrate-binding protein [Gilvimarinus sp. SDUM040013]MDX6850744.1 carbohydrate-binding protein [Gilvimarinus sp. SDUM040013]